eukprot:CAMPEP_0118657612 /NCGR_PEP_ID=MMETSP0785-20121206/14114_1 /TAXON_ID=91992 /ORGANISM="Bolidomonas pacifica, Strain CCMP 1866" /LENGTH=814 /DNA_ID=CAMNT_0006550547 /DNA_START=63 /DNA_END=2503 /DNA_ORIENTATION=-
MDDQQQNLSYPVLVIGREIKGQGSSRFVSFRLSLPAMLHTTLSDGSTLNYVNTRYSYVEALRTSLLQAYPTLDLPMLDSKRLLGTLSSSVVNQRTRIINNFLRTCQESDTIKASRQWGEFLRGQKPGAPPGTPQHPTSAELRGEGRSDAAPAPGLSENPAAVRGMSFGWLLENLGLNSAEPPSTPTALPDYAVEEGAPPSPASPNTTRESISNEVDSDDEDDMETVVANGAAIATPRQVMRQEYYRMVQEARGRAKPTNRNLFTGTPEELEKGEALSTKIVKSLPPLVFEFVGCFFLGLVVNFIRSGPSSSLTSNSTYTSPQLFTLAFSVTALTFSMGHVSGGHLNPAVTFTVFLRRHLTFLQMLCYMVFQFLGFLTAAVTSVEVLGGILSPTELRTSHAAGGLDTINSFAVGAIFMFAVCYTVLCTSTSAAQTGNSHFGMASGFSLAVGMVVNAMLGTRITLNTSLDVSLICAKTFYDADFPDFAAFDKYARFYDNGDDNMWYYLAGPAAGAFLAALVYRYVKMTAFTKRSHGCINATLKIIAPYLVECFGTFMITFTWLVAFPSDQTSDLAWSNLASLYMAITIAMSYAGGFISGGHFNPAITFAVTIQGGLPVANFFVYLFWQLVGAAGAGSIVWQLFSKTPVPGIGQDITDKNAGIMEGLFSYLLAFVFLNCASAKDNRGNSFFGLSYGAVLYVSTMLLGRVTTGVENPAIGLGAYAARNFWNNDDNYLDSLEDCWVSCGVPMAGALVAALTFRACEVGGMWIHCPACCKRGKKEGGGGDEESYDGMEMSNRMSNPDGGRSESSLPVAEA